MMPRYIDQEEMTPQEVVDDLMKREKYINIDDMISKINKAIEAINFYLYEREDTVLAQELTNEFEHIKQELQYRLTCAIEIKK
jgi:hypothetical protein